MAPLYRYRPIRSNQIRLLELVLDEQQLIGEIAHYDLSKDTSSDRWTSTLAPAYNALSHHWDLKPKAGEEVPFIEIRNGNASGKIHIRPNLKAALEAIRDKMRNDPDHWTPFLWVDAICIDQLSSEDKDKQLPIMGDIYVGAERVIVWLGKLESDLERAISFIRSLQDLSQLRKVLTCEDYTNDWKAFAMMTRNPWFTRLWIVQEIAAARDAVLLAGCESVPWEDFAGALSLFVSQFEAVRTMLAQSGAFAKDRNFLGDIKLSGANILVETRGVVLRKRANGDVAEHLKSLEALLTSLSMFAVTEPHDVVYAILWLSSDASQGKKRLRGLSHRFNHSTPRLASVREPQVESEESPPVHVQHFYSAAGSVSSMSTEDLMSSSTSSFEIPLTRRHSTSHQFLDVPAQQAEQQQADQDLIRETGITVNYQQTVYDLCKQVLEHVIKTTKRLDIICYHWAPGPRLKDPDARPPREVDEPLHPTWLLHTRKDTYAKRKPDTQYLSKPVKRVNPEPFIGRPGARPRPYLACGRTRADDVKIEGRVLHAYGYPLASIADIGGTARNAIIPSDWREKLGWNDIDEYPPGRFWRTLVADKGPDNQRPPPRFKLACKWAFKLGPEDGHLDLNDIRNDGDGEAPLKEFIDCCIPTVWNRRLFLSGECPQEPESNFVGLGPTEAQVGDVICILWGCAVPVLLRPKKAQDRASTNSSASLRNGLTLKVNFEEQHSLDYTFVGECSVYGMMDGEVFHYVDSHRISIQDFYIH